MKNNITKQIISYIFVGGVSSLFDIGVTYGLNYSGIYYVYASTAGFLFATIINYFLSYLVSFQRGKYNRVEEILRLFLVSLVALFLNTLIVYLTVEFFNFSLIIAKAIAIVLVLIWNFLARKFLVFFSYMPKSDVCLKD